MAKFTIRPTYLITVLLSVITYAQLATSEQLFNNQITGLVPDLEGPVNAGLLLEENNNFIKAVDYYEAEYIRLEDSHGPYSSQLINPLTGSARSNFALGEYGKAKENLQHAQHLIHRFDGVLSMQQMEAIEILANIYLAQGKPKDADAQQRFALSLAERNFDTDSLALLPAMDKITKWYRETGQLNKARRSLLRSTKIITVNANAGDTRLIPYLEQQAKIKRLQRICCSQDILLQAVHIAESKSNTNSALKGRLYAELADAYIVAGKRDDAEKYYKLAWTNMTDAQRLSQFSVPQKIALSKTLELSRSPPSRMYKFRLDALSQKQLREISPQDQLILGSLPPQEFFLPLSEENYKVRIRDTYYPSVIEEDYVEVVGYPFQFVRKQVEQILPFKLQKKERLAQLEVELAFTVGKWGELSDIKITNSNSPKRIDQLMRRVLRITRMRPRMLDGEPVETNMVLLSQTFR